MSVSWTGNGIGRCRYGSNALWTLHGDLAGSRARRFAERVGLFFRSETAALYCLSILSYEMESQAEA